VSRRCIAAFALLETHPSSTIRTANSAPDADSQARDVEWRVTFEELSAMVNFGTQVSTGPSLPE
jgi:hypothetical protein